MSSDQRLFFVVNSLIKSSRTIPEIMKLYKDAYNCNCKHRDISNDIKKLEECGFVINKEKIKGNNSYFYKIDKTIFQISLSDNEIELIKKLFLDYKNNLNIISSIFEKFSYIANVDIEEILEIKKTKSDNDLYDKIKSLILKAIKEKRKVRFYYDPINTTN